MNRKPLSKSVQFDLFQGGNGSNFALQTAPKTAPLGIKGNTEPVLKINDLQLPFFTTDFTKAVSSISMTAQDLELELERLDRDYYGEKYDTYRTVLRPFQAAEMSAYIAEHRAWAQQYQLENAQQQAEADRQYKIGLIFSVVQLCYHSLCCSADSFYYVNEETAQYFSDFDKYISDFIRQSATDSFRFTDEMQEIRSTEPTHDREQWFYKTTVNPIHQNNLNAVVQHTQPQDDLQTLRSQRYKRQTAVRSLFKPIDKKAVCNCGRMLKHGSEGVKIMRSIETGRASYTGLQTCGSPWDCAVCSAVISERRRKELMHATSQHLQLYGQLSLFLVTLTFSHNLNDDLKQTMQALAKATAWFYRHRDYKNLKAKIGKIGYVRALEVTHGDTNGWHPHIHEIWFLDRNHWDFYETKKQIFDLWRRSCIKFGLGEPNETHGVDVKDAKYAASYISKFGEEKTDGSQTVTKSRKWGIEDELTKHMAKKSRKGAKEATKDTPAVKGSRTNWQLLDDYMAGDKQAGALFREFSHAFFRKQQLRWSAGLKDLYGVKDLTDQELAEKTDKFTYEYAAISKQDWQIIRSTCTKQHDTRAMLLSLAETLPYPEFINSIDRLCGRPPTHSVQPQPLLTLLTH